MDNLLFFISDHGYLIAFILFFSGLFCGVYGGIHSSKFISNLSGFIIFCILFLSFFTVVVTKNKALDHTTSIHLIKKAIFLKNHSSDKFNLAFYCDTITPHINSKECWSKVSTMNKKEILALQLSTKK